VLIHAAVSCPAAGDLCTKLAEQVLQSIRLGEHYIHCLNGANPVGPVAFRMEDLSILPKSRKHLTYLVNLYEAGDKGMDYLTGSADVPIASRATRVRLGSIDEPQPPDKQASMPYDVDGKT